MGAFGEVGEVTAATGDVGVDLVGEGGGPVCASTLLGFGEEVRVDEAEGIKEFPDVFGADPRGALAGPGFV